MDIEVAVKILRLSALDDDTVLAQFGDELRTLALLSEHPNIVHMFRQGTFRDRPYVVLRYYPRSAHEVVTIDGPLSVDQVLDWGIKVAGAVEFAHRQQILHRDIKPSNVLIDKFEDPALGDWGNSLSDAAFVDSKPDAISVQWSAPELTGGRSAPVSDVFGLAATLYTLLARRSPFWDDQPGGDNSLAAIIRRVTAGEPFPLGHPDVSTELESLLRAGLARDPADRPDSALKFASRLQDVQTSLGLSVTHPKFDIDGRKGRSRTPATSADSRNTATSPASHAHSGNGRGAQPRTPDVDSLADFAKALDRLMCSRQLDYTAVADRADGVLGRSSSIDLRLKQVMRGDGTLGRDFVATFLHACFCDKQGPCAPECSTDLVGPWLSVWDRLTMAGPPPRRRRWPYVAATTAMLVIGTSAGIYLAAQHDAQPHDTPPVTTVPAQAGTYRVPASVVYQRETETATVNWNAKAAELPGFQAFLVIMTEDGKSTEQVGGGLQPGTRDSIVVVGVRAAHRVCFEVVAYGVTSVQEVVPPPACATNGQASPTPGPTP